MSADICHFTRPASGHVKHSAGRPMCGWLVHYRNGQTAFIMSDPIHWPAEVIPQVLSIIPMQEPPESRCNCINCTDGEPA